ncbi:bifunctional PRP4-like superfamily/Pre-mRNA processing factor 4 (PRP4)-like/Pre-mRNA-splicing factor 18/Prp18 [Babesia duncani]|uniref:Pre-mRNA-splicing factor 18 n=1 Tax=Babesia duncani TaxID=323732 RepID=A0AAD9UMH5_9APIC|nr:bifunctional PRP4-like superfamily/Pre-mRNA processing factor 4 (PRP4)-like/Pre-mRNA-splicing factor 18/Prp18 [Babesia duncani]KAK2197744.1 bifunctional PRP4-like superfamily/Pre-mRNA processing factor 4 (PRP4)-like/Pre-mRNA-splicing factor 18/Prp18 [Babesia duncani]
MRKIYARIGIKQKDQKWLRQSDKLALERTRAQQQIQQANTSKKQCLDERLKVRAPNPQVYKNRNYKSITNIRDEKRLQRNLVMHATRVTFNTSLALSEIEQENVIRRLRKLQEPIILFGESIEDRARRLIQISLDASHNLYNKTNASDPTSLIAQDKSQGLIFHVNAIVQGQLYNFFEDCNGLDPESQHYKVLHWIATMLNTWENEIANKTENCNKEKSRDILIQTTRGIKPLSRLLKTKKIDATVLKRLYNIVVACEQGEYKRAHDDYMLLAIGNAAWPMGVTMVGIHERAGRSKIFTSEVAHILNDETTRKYIQMFKRLISFAQSRFATDSSKIVQISTSHV